MTLDQITTWASSDEFETQEFKRTTGQRRKVARTLCTFLNHRGGWVLFGKELGLPKPDIQKIPGTGLVQFCMKPTGGNPSAVFEPLEEYPDITVSQLAARLKKSELPIHWAIQTFRESGRLERIGPDKGGRWQVIE